jgi:hypothetical protein
VLKLISLLFLLYILGACAQAPTGQGVAHLNWETSFGGVSADACASAKANAALARLGCGSQRVHIQVLNNEAPVAFSFPDGSIYVARGLVDRLTADELAAAIAHEMGHLLHDGIIQSPAALRGMAGPPNGAGIETAADVLGREVLVAAAIPTGALPSALEKVAEASRGERCYGPLCSRVAYLRSLDAAGR